MDELEQGAERMKTQEQAELIQESDAPLQLCELSTEELYEAMCRYLKIEHYAIQPVKIQKVDAHYEPDTSIFEVPQERGK